MSRENKCSCLPEQLTASAFTEFRDPSLGNGITHSGLGFPTSMNNQDSSSQTYHGQNGSRSFLNDDSSQGIVGCVKLTVNNQHSLLRLIQGKIQIKTEDKTSQWRLQN